MEMWKWLMRLKYSQFIAETTYGQQYLTSSGLCDKLNIIVLLFFLGLRRIISVPPDMKHFALIFFIFP